MAALLVDLVDGAGKHTSVLENGGASSHSVSFTGTSLTVAHDRSIETVNDFVDCLLCTVLKYFLLRSVMHDFVEFECPLLLLIVD